MASLNHPFLVNLAYSFQNTEFLVLVMDLVPAGDLSEFVLTKKRLTPEQARPLHPAAPTRARTLSLTRTLTPTLTPTVTLTPSLTLTLQVRFIVMEVVCVMYYCHTQMVLYRDLKPENVLIDADGHA